MMREARKQRAHHESNKTAHARTLHRQNST
jgi:hypothetical protein